MFCRRPLSLVVVELPSCLLSSLGRTAALACSAGPPVRSPAPVTGFLSS